MLNNQLILKKPGNATDHRACDRTWWGQGSLLGGYTQALILAAMRLEVADESKQALSLNCHFLRPVLDSEVRITVDIERAGRKLSNVRASLYCGDRLAVVALGIFAQKQASHDFSVITKPQYAPIGVEEVPADTGVGLHAHSHFGFYPRLGSFQRGMEVAKVAGWLQPLWQVEAKEPVDDCLLALVADLWVPAAFHYWPANVGVVGLEINVQFRASNDILANTAGPLLLSLESKQASNGYVDEDGLIWNSAGDLLCQYRQMRLILDM